VQAFKEAQKSWDYAVAARLTIDRDRMLKDCILAAILTYEAYKEAEANQIERELAEEGRESDYKEYLHHLST
jgi:hypothetical protein